MMLALLFALQAAAADAVPAQDTVPQVTLSDALRRAAQLDPDYVQALGRIDNAEWSRRAAMLTFILPSVSVGLDETKYSQDFFNPANPAVPTSTLVVGRATANYEIFSVRKFAELGRTKAELASAEAGEVEQRFQAALETESSYYDVLVNQELKRVADERVARAREGLAVARARVASGAAVPTDSLQLVLELTRAQVDVLRQQNALRTARLDLGRRVGVAGPVDAAPTRRPRSSRAVRSAFCWRSTSTCARVSSSTSWRESVGTAAPEETRARATASPSRARATRSSATRLSSWFTSTS
ncbi:MAG TPA: TolC family protein [Gemmatimonadales bacterium]|nr:TolC family protein [Gemmatimonadales bacterium]